MGGLWRGWAMVAAVLAGLAGVVVMVGAAGPLADDAPAVLAVNPPRDATGVAVGAAQDGSLAVTFTEAVTITAGALELNCERSGGHAPAAGGGPVAYSFVSDRAFLPGEMCMGVMRADYVSDADADDPPDSPQFDFAWSFRVAGEPVVINEVDAITPVGLGDFVELYDGGRGDTPLDGLTVVFYRGDEASVYLAVELDGYRTDGRGYFVLGAGEVAGADLPLANDALRDGPDAVTVYDAPKSRFPRGAPVSLDGLLDAVVYGPADERLLALLVAGQGPLDEGARGDAAADSSQRCPNGKGRPRETESFLANYSSPDTVNNCIVDQPPRVVAAWPDQGETGVGLDEAVEVEFSEPVTLLAGALAINCTDSGGHDYSIQGSGRTYSFVPVEPFAPAEVCSVSVFAERVKDDDTSDPPDLMIADMVWTFTTERIVPDGLVINEVDADTPGIDAAEFVELYDGGFGNTPLDGLAVIFFNGADDAGYYIVELDGFFTDERGYFILGNGGIAGASINFPDGLLQNGPDAVALVVGDIANFPDNVPISAIVAVDAIVYSRLTQYDSGLQPLLNPGQPQIDENARGKADDHSLQRCPNGTGGKRNTAGFKANTPTPGAANDCITDTPPRVAGFSPGRGATGIGINTSITVTFDEPVTVSSRWATIRCQATGTYAYRVSGGPTIFILEPTTPFSYTDDCTVTISGDRVSDRDSDDPPDTMTGKTTWTFTTADPPADFIVINEIDPDTPSIDTAEFLELFDGGVGSTALDGLALVFFNGSNNLSYFSVDLDGRSTDSLGYYVIGNEAIQPDLIISNGVLQNGPDAVALYAADSSRFPTGSAITTEGLVDAVVYGDPAAVSSELLALLISGEKPADERARGAADIHSLQRCPNGAGGQRKTASFIANTPSVREPSHCITDDAPSVISTNPESGATGIPQNSSFTVTFSEPVQLGDGAIRLSCSAGVDRAVSITGGPVIFIVSPNDVLPSVQRCNVIIKAAAVLDEDRNDPPDAMVADFGWSFTTSAPPADFILINEVDADTPGSDAAEFIELFDGGRGNTSLTGLILVFYNGFDDRSYYVIDLAGHSTDDEGYIVIGNKGVPEAALEFPTGILQNGADAVALYIGRVTDFPAGTSLHTNGLQDALVYGTNDLTDEGLLVLLEPGEKFVDEAGGGAADSHSSGRCPNGTGGQRRSATYRQGAPSPGNVNICIADEPPVVVSVYPEQGATDIPLMPNVKITFNEEVALNSGWITIQCESSGVHGGSVSGGPKEYQVTSNKQYSPRERCDVTLWALKINDVDADDPPDHMTADYRWSFTTATLPPDFVMINELDSNTPGSDTEEFVELYDGGIGNTDLSGLVLVLWNGNSDTSYRAIDLSGHRTDSAGYFIAGNASVNSVDVILGNGTLQNGADAVSLHVGRSADFATGTSVVTTGIIDAVVYGPGEKPDEGLLKLIDTGQLQVDENRFSKVETHSLQRCPNGAGGKRQTETYRPDIPTPGIANHCTADLAPEIIDINPAEGAIGIGWSSAVQVRFSEDVQVSDGWLVIDCGSSGRHDMVTSGGPRTFYASPVSPYSPAETCEILVTAPSVVDADTDDPPDHPVSDYSSRFSTAPDPPGFVLINEVDTDTPGTDKAEFIELFDGGAGDTDLSGLVIVLWNGKNDNAYRSIDLDGYRTNETGYFLVANKDMPGVDLVLPAGALQNGPDAVALIMGNAAEYPPGTGLNIANVVDALVYGPGDTPDDGLLQLLEAGQSQLDEAGRGDAEVDSMQRCPNGAGGLRRTSGYQLNNPSPGQMNMCRQPDEAPVVVGIVPPEGEQEVDPDVVITVEFSEDVTLEDGWFGIVCQSGSRAAAVSGGPKVFTVTPDVPFAPDESCTVRILASAVRDADADDPPDNLIADFDWSFHTAGAPPPPPVADFTTNSPVWIGDPVVFANTSAGTGPLSFVWDFGDGGLPSTEANPTHRYAAVGEFTVTLTATGPAGTGSRWAVVAVRPRVVYVGVVVGRGGGLGAAHILKVP